MSQSAKELKEVLDLLPAIAKALDKVSEDGKLGLTDLSALIGLYSSVKVAFNGLGQVNLKELEGPEVEALLSQAVGGAVALGGAIKQAYERMAK